MTVDCKKINVKLNSTGEYVKEVQKYLTYEGLYNRTIDGQCGSYTVDAIKKLQTKLKIKVDGIFGQITCTSSKINGKDISKNSGEVSLTMFKDMIQRFEKYTREKSVEPNLVYLDLNNPYEYVSKAKYKDMKSRYDSYVKSKGKEPLIIYLNPSNTTTTSTTTTSNSSTLFVSSPHFETQGVEKLGQSNKYRCGPHSARQLLCKFGITRYGEATIASYMGTTTSGTGHYGIETGLAKIASLEGIKLKVEWKNFSDLGKTRDERFKALGKLISTSNVGVILHNLYRNQYGHYECLKSINTPNSSTVVLNSLGNKCTSVGYCGYLETRSYSNWVSYLSGISQKSLCIVTLVK